jgi:hypothetical protein
MQSIEWVACFLFSKQYHVAYLREGELLFSQDSFILRAYNQVYLGGRAEEETMMGISLQESLTILIYFSAFIVPGR